MSDTEAKTQEATARKLRRQRDEGSVPQGQEIAGYVAAAAGIGTAAALLPSVPERLSRLLDAGLRLSDVPPEATFASARDELIPELVMLVTPVAGAAVGASVVTLLIWNKGVLFAMKPVTPDITRISPLAGLKRIYGRRGWTETGIGLLRVGVWTGLAAAVGTTILPRLFRHPGCEAACQWALLLPLPWALAACAGAVMLGAAGFEMLIQRSLFLHEQRMTESEVKRERKEQSGAPEIRRERRRRQREDSQGAGAVGINRSNMCFFYGNRAVALRYHSVKTPVPRLSAKATGAAKVASLRADVRERGFPEQEDAALTAAFHALGPGDPVGQEHYDKLAAAIREMFQGAARL